MATSSAPSSPLQLTCGDTGRRSRPRDKATQVRDKATQLREKATQKPFWRYHSSRNQSADFFSDLYAMIGLAFDIIPIQIVGPDMQLEKV